MLWYLNVRPESPGLAGEVRLVWCDLVQANMMIEGVGQVGICVHEESQERKQQDRWILNSAE